MKIVISGASKTVAMATTNSSPGKSRAFIQSRGPVTGCLSLGTEAVTLQRCRA